MAGVAIYVSHWRAYGSERYVAPWQIGKWLCSLGTPFSGESESISAAFGRYTALCVVDDFGNLVGVP